MSESSDPQSPELAALAKRFLDMWQDQATALAGDPAATAGFTRMWQAAMAPFAAAMAGTTHAPRAAPAAAAPDGRVGELDQLARRVAILEERLAALESAPRDRGRDP